MTWTSPRKIIIASCLPKRKVSMLVWLFKYESVFFCKSVDLMWNDLSRFLWDTLYDLNVVYIITMLNFVILDLGYSLSHKEACYMIISLCACIFFIIYRLLCQEDFMLTQLSFRLIVRDDKMIFLEMINQHGTLLAEV